MLSPAQYPSTAAQEDESRPEGPEVLVDIAHCPPFPSHYRASGVLLHVTSLPSRYGIGDIGPGALAWIDLLHDCGQRWWQGLPLGPTGYGDSPYQPLSSFAGNGLLVSPDWLIEDGLLHPDDCAVEHLPSGTVDYAAAFSFKRRLLDKAWARLHRSAHRSLQSQFKQFRSMQSQWLEDYALFRALREKLGTRSYLEWPAELIERNARALAVARRELAVTIDQVCFAQFLFHRQSERLRQYARARDVRLIGDVPFFVSPDSSDVWAYPELFVLDAGRRPRFVAGVPPDDFSATGQLWGNPVYNWDEHARTGYAWWTDRLRSLLEDVDVIRLDHFRACAAAWHVPADAPTAESGCWMPGPGAELLRAFKNQLGALPFIAEDLGYITPDVYALRDQFGLPGMRVLQFAFNGEASNPHQPRNFIANTVVYTGTHDNPTTRGWFEELPHHRQRAVWEQLHRPPNTRVEIAWELIRLGWSSIASLAIAPLQDILNLGGDARMNVPGRATGNWRWRCTEEMLRSPYLMRLLDLTRQTGRADPGQTAARSV